MKKRQLLLRMRDSTENELSALRSESFDLLDDSSDGQSGSAATYLEDLSGLLSPLDVRQAVQALERIRH
jgi:hypothetical protein